MPPADRRVREIVKARTVANCVVITLPLSVREPLGIEAGDRVSVEVEMDGRLTVTPENNADARYERKRAKKRRKADGL